MKLFINLCGQRLGEIEQIVVLERFKHISEFLLSRIVCLFCILIFFSSVSSQYINPEFGGAVATGFGEVGGQVLGQYSGLYNPATLNPNIGRINFSVLTGQYSDYLLYYPTLKDISISYPLIKRQLAFQIHYGRSRDNSMRYFRGGTWYKNPLYGYNGGRKSFGFTARYRPPLNQWFHKSNLFNLSIGFDVSRVWGQLANSNRNNNSDFWLNSVKYLNGANIAFGTYVKLDFSARFKLLFSTVVQGGIADNLNNKWLDFYSLGFGFLYRPTNQSNNSLQMGLEVENVHLLQKRKLGMGLKYNFTNHVENSLQCGIYTYPKNYENSTYRNHQVYWYTFGFTKSLSSAIFALSLSDAINIDLSKQGINSSDIAKVVSLSVSVPIPDITKSGINKPVKSPEFVDIRLTNRRIVLGQTDTLSFVLQYFGNDDFDINNVYFNVTPKTGLILLVPFTTIPVLRHNDVFEIKIPFHAISSQPLKDYTIYANLTYDNNKSIRKEFAITSVKPIINVSTSLGNLHRYFLFPVPGSYILEFNFRNDGTTKCDSLEIELSRNLLELGFIDTNLYQVNSIKPGTTKSIKISMNTTRSNLPPRIPVTITFKESMGFDPLPIHADIVIIDKSKVAYSEDKKDPFISEFVEFDSFYVVLNFLVGQVSQAPLQYRS